MAIQFSISTWGVENSNKLLTVFPRGDFLGLRNFLGGIFKKFCFLKLKRLTLLRLN